MNHTQPQELLGINVVMYVYCHCDCGSSWQPVSLGSLLLGMLGVVWESTEVRMLLPRTGDQSSFV